MKTLDRLDHEEARQALALFSEMEDATKGRDVDAILAASTNMVAETILPGCDSRKEAERIADDVATFPDHSQILESVSPKAQIVHTRP